MHRCLRPASVLVFVHSLMACSSSNITQFELAGGSGSTLASATGGRSGAGGSSEMNVGGTSSDTAGSSSVSTGGTQNTVTTGGKTSGNSTSTSTGGNATGGTSSSVGTQSTATLVATGGAAATGGASAGSGGATTSASSATVTGGSSATGGVAAAGGVTATGGAVATGGVASTGGAVATGGVASTGGMASTGGSHVTGGAPATGGASPATGGAAVCNVTECEKQNPHKPTCVMSCVSNACKASVRTDLGLAIQSGAKDSAQRTGVWSSTNVPYLVYPTANTTPVSIMIQPLDSNGATTTATSVNMPASVTSIGTIAAAMNGDQLGVLWHGNRSDGDGVQTTEFTLTSLTGSYKDPVVVGHMSLPNLYDYMSYTLFAHPLSSTSWALVEHGGIARHNWSGYVFSTGNPPTDTPLTDNDNLAFSPTSAAVRSSIRPTPEAAVVVNGVLFISGLDSEWTWDSPNQPSLVLGRYNASTLALLDPPRAELSLSSYPTDKDTYEKTAALGKLGNRLAAFWTEYSGTGALLLGKALYDTSSITAIVRTAVPSNLIPKAFVETPTGAGLLIAAQVDATGSQTTYTVVAQRVDANLGFVGSPYPINLASTVEPIQVMARPSTDGRVLVTFRQDYAQHRIVHADLCQ